MNCQSCGMPMDKPEDHGGADANNPFCEYCTDAQGNLLPKDQVRAKMIQFYVQKQSKTQAEAEKLTDQLMANMPAWKGKTESPGMAAGVSQPTSSSTAKPTPVAGPTPTPTPTTKSASEEMPSATPITPQPTGTTPSSPLPSEKPMTSGGPSEPSTE